MGSPSAWAPREVNGCVIDAQCLEPIRGCTIQAGPNEPHDDWRHACIHPQTVAYSCGRLARPGRPNLHDHDRVEIEQCRRLAGEAAKLMEGVEINESEGSSVLLPFFITANRGEKGPATITEEFLRSGFNETIYPQAKITIAPLKEQGKAWSAFGVSESDNDVSNVPPQFRESARSAAALQRQENEKRAQRWRALFTWYQAHKEFRDARFVMIGENPLSKLNFGCQFPRIVFGMTEAGSLVGICGDAVQT